MIELMQSMQAMIELTPKDIGQIAEESLNLSVTDFEKKFKFVVQFNTDWMGVKAYNILLPEEKIGVAKDVCSILSKVIDLEANKPVDLESDLSPIGQLTTKSDISIAAKLLLETWTQELAKLKIPAKPKKPSVLRTMRRALSGKSKRSKKSKRKSKRQ